MNLEKSSFFADSINILGFQFDSQGHKPVASFAPRVENFPTPQTRKDIQKFLGVVNYYRAHIPNLADLAAPLYEALKTHQKFQWTTKHQQSFEIIRTALLERIPLHKITDSVPLQLYTDASQLAAGAVLKQTDRTIAYYSKKFTPTEQRYSTFDREALAMVASLKHFRHRLLGRRFSVYTDHKPLTYWLKRPPVSERHARWAVAVQDLNFEIVHLPGTENFTADILSRSTADNLLPLQPTVAAIALSEQQLPIQQAQTQEFIEGLKLPSHAQVKLVNGLWCETSSDTPKILLPLQYREQTIALAHNLGHTGVKRTYNTIRLSYLWPGMKGDVASYVRRCQQCQQNKPTSTPTRTPVKFPPTDRFQTVHIDLVGPLIPSRTGKTYLFTMIDRYTKWLEAIPMTSITAEACAKALYRHWIARFGIPHNIISDQGPQFESQLFNDVLSLLGISRQHTTPYHPAANGQVERSHRTLKESLRCLSSQFPDWEEALPAALLSMRNAINEAGFSPATLVYGEHLSVPASLCNPEEVLPSAPSELVQQLYNTFHTVRTVFSATQVPSTAQTHAFPHTHVWVQDPVRKHGLAPRYTGPYLVLKYQHPVVTIDKEGKEYHINRDRVKPAWLNQPMIANPTPTPTHQPPNILVRLPQHLQLPNLPQPGMREQPPLAGQPPIPARPNPGHPPQIPERGGPIPQVIPLIPQPPPEARNPRAAPQPAQAIHYSRYGRPLRPVVRYNR